MVDHLLPRRIHINITLVSAHHVISRIVDASHPATAQSTVRVNFVLTPHLLVLLTMSRLLASLPDRPARRQSLAAERAQHGSDDFPIHPLPPLPFVPQPTREQKEKAMILARKEKFIRHSADAIQLPLDIQTSSPHYLSDAERLHTNVLLDQKQQQYADTLHYQQTLQTKRDRLLARSTHSSQLVHNAQQRQQAHQARLQSSATASLKNQPSMPVNLLTQHYDSSVEGVELQYRDSVMRWRAAVRSAELDRRGNGEWNPITQERRHAMPMPNRPQQPVWQQAEEKKECGI